jgi:hypothetical protein
VEHGKVVRYMNSEVMTVRTIIADFLSQAHTEGGPSGSLSQGLWPT